VSAAWKDGKFVLEMESKSHVGVMRAPGNLHGPEQCALAEFFAGVSVAPPAACREERTWEKIVEWYRAHVGIADRIEQDAWNALYWRRVAALPGKGWPGTATQATDSPSFILCLRRQSAHQTVRLATASGPFRLFFVA
jgi:hypothetical protein